MTDNSELIKLLRDSAKSPRYQQEAYHVTMNAAADEIERLNTLVRDLSELIHKFRSQYHNQTEPNETHNRSPA